MPRSLSTRKPPSLPISHIGRVVLWPRTPRSWLLRDGLETSGGEGFPGVSEGHRLLVCPRPPESGSALEPRPQGVGTYTGACEAQPPWSDLQLGFFPRLLLPSPHSSSVASWGSAVIQSTMFQPGFLTFHSPPADASNVISLQRLPDRCD